LLFRDSWGAPHKSAVTGHKYADRARFCSSILLNFFLSRFLSQPFSFCLTHFTQLLFSSFRLRCGTDWILEFVDTNKIIYSTYSGLKHEDFDYFQCDAQNNSTKTMGRTVDQEVHAAFVEFRAKEDDKARDPVSW